MDALRRLLPLALAALLPACTCAKVPDDVHFACETDGECPSGERCVDGYCRTSLDGALPVRTDAGSADAGEEPGPDAGGKETACWDNADDDGDLAIDCSDPDCLDQACGGAGQCDADGRCACPPNERLCNRVCQGGSGCCSSEDCGPKGSVCDEGTCKCGRDPACTGDKVCGGDACICPGSTKDCGQGRCRQCCTQTDCTDGTSVCLANGTCGLCGTEGKPCCPEGMPICADGDLSCAPTTRTCERCGGDGMPCCAGDSCNAGRVCLGNKTCAPCGTLGNTCCAGASCGGTGADTELACEFGTCTTLGFPASGCTFEQQCFPGARCLTVGIVANCQACGMTSGPCCPGNSCKAGCCAGGVCVGVDALCGLEGTTCQATGDCLANSGPCGGAGQVSCKGSCTAPGTRLNGATCEACGHKEGPCCDGACPSSPNLVCVGDVCKTCGNVGAPCCLGGTCSSGCCVEGTCVAVGAPCSSESSGSDDALCLTTGRCSGCGAKGAPCCTGPDGKPSVCEPPLTCLQAVCT